MLEKLFKPLGHSDLVENVSPTAYSVYCNSSCQIYRGPDASFYKSDSPVGRKEYLGRSWDDVRIHLEGRCPV